MKATESIALRAAVAFAASIGCGQGSSAREQAKLDSLSFDVPAHWHRADTSARGVVTAVWTPDDNESRKESVTVIRSSLSPAVAKTGAATLERLLASAAALPGAHASTARSITTPRGLQGARIEVDYVPPGLKRSYHRVHVVLVDPDGDALVHVVYTALTPDDDLDALNLVLGSIRHGEA